MRVFTHRIILFVLVFAPAGVHAAEKFDAAAEANVVAPFIEQETVAVVHVDFSRLSVEPVVAMLSRLVPDVKEEFAAGVPVVARRLNAFRRTGGKDAYLIVSLGGETMYPRAFLVLPVGPATDEKALRAALEIPANAGRRVGDVLVLPSAPSAQLPAEFCPVARPELVPAFSAAGDAAVQAVLIPPASTRRVIEELMPQLPNEIGNGPGTVLTRGISWAAVGLDLPPQLAARLVIKSQDGQAADSLRAKWTEVLQLAGQQEEVRRATPQFEKLAALLAPKVEGDRLILSLDDKDHAVSEILATLLSTPVEHARDAAKRAQSMNNLKQLGLAMHAYYDKFKHFPAPASSDKDGKPLLSWRVHILPYLDQEQLYQQFHLDEPWDGPHNTALIEKMPAVFRSPKSKAGQGLTNYVVPVGDGALFFSMNDEATFKDIKDGASHTLMTIEVDDPHAVVWTKPADMAFDPENPRKGIGNLFEQGLVAGMCDGSVRSFSKDLEPKTLKGLITRAGGEALNAADF